jgi:hypothetical protein
MTAFPEGDIGKEDEQRHSARDRRFIDTTHITPEPEDCGFIVGEATAVLPWGPCVAPLASGPCRELRPVTSDELARARAAPRTPDLAAAYRTIRLGEITPLRVAIRAPRCRTFRQREEAP